MQKGIAGLALKQIVDHTKSVNIGPNDGVLRLRMTFKQL